MQPSCRADPKTTIFYSLQRYIEAISVQTTQVFLPPADTIIY
jgi:hypothetical protein